MLTRNAEWFIVNSIRIVTVPFVREGQVFWTASLYMEGSEKPVWHCTKQYKSPEACGYAAKKWLQRKGAGN